MAKQKLYNLPKDAENAFQIWSVLVWAAKCRQTLTYEELSVPTGIYQRNAEMALGVIKNYCVKHLPKGCHLTVLVVEKGTGKPGKGILDVVPESEFDKVREKVFALAQTNKKNETKWKKMLNNPGLQAFRDFVKKWNDRESSAS